MSGLGETLRLLFQRISDHIERALDDANGDVVEALHGHVCDADCWHNAWVGIQPAHWLGCPDDEKEHAFPLSITERHRAGKRHYSACGNAMLRVPTHLKAKRGRCEVCKRVVGRHVG